MGMDLPWGGSVELARLVLSAEECTGSKLSVFALDIKPNLV